jgi:hypothetical protein
MEARQARSDLALMDHRPGAAVQRQVAARANHGPLAMQQKACIGMANGGSRALQLKALVARIGDSPRMVAQRMAGDTALPRGPVAQLTSLNGHLVDTEVPYPNPNQAAVLNHMAGEWDGESGHAVTGGHLLSAMTAQWGAAVARSVPGNASAEGVHFAGALPGNNITPHQHSFRLVRVNPGDQRTKISSAKESTFWPRNWTAGELAGTLNHSFQNGAANMWASKENMSYWYRWQTLGANTLFPVEKVATATGTERNNNKSKRARQV